VGLRLGEVETHFKLKELQLSLMPDLGRVHVTSRVETVVTTTLSIAESKLSKIKVIFVSSSLCIIPKYKIMSWGTERNLKRPWNVRGMYTIKSEVYHQCIAAS
jgi:hypothetical protein